MIKVTCDFKTGYCECDTSGKKVNVLMNCLMAIVGITDFVKNSFPDAYSIFMRSLNAELSSRSAFQQTLFIDLAEARKQKEDTDGS